MEMQKEAKIKILVELDALLDTRLGAIAFLNPQVADSILENSASYVERKSDEFDRVDSRINLEEYKQVYKERGKKEICKFSFLTVFVDTLDIMIRDMERKASMGNPEYSLPTLDVNIYPYIFNEGEKESLIETLSELLGFNPEKINCVYEPYTGLNIDYFRTADYSLVVFYNFTTCQKMNFHILAPTVWPKWLIFLISKLPSGQLKLAELFFYLNQSIS